MGPPLKPGGGPTPLSGAPVRGGMYKLAIVMRSLVWIQICRSVLCVLILVGKFRSMDVVLNLSE